MNIGRLAGTSVITAVAASLCCITPVLALIAGSGSVAASFSWLEPARPYLIGLTVAVLAFSWYVQLKPQPKDECGCVVEKKGFLQSKAFLLIITLFSALMLSFPVYAKFFYPKSSNAPVIVNDANLRVVTLDISGMTCAACEEHVKNEFGKVPGIVESKVSYDNKNAIVSFDKSKATINDIIKAVEEAGYKVTNNNLKN